MAEDYIPEYEHYDDIFDDNNYEENPNEETEEPTEESSEETENSDEEDFPGETDEDDGDQSEIKDREDSSDNGTDEDESKSEPETTDQEIEEIEIEAPDFFPDEMIPGEFKDEKEELEFYRNNYGKALNYFKHPDFAKTIENEYEESLAQIEDRYKEHKAIGEMLEGNPETALKLHNPRYLAQLGGDASLSQDEATQYMTNKLEKEFGKDFREKYNPNELHDVDSLSSKMNRRQQEINNEIMEINNKSKEINEKINPSPEKQKEKLVNDYEPFKEAGYSEEEYQDFVKESLDKIQEGDFSFGDLHKFLYFDDYINDAYNRGKESGKKNLQKNIERTAESLPEKPEKTTSKNEPESPGMRVNDIISFPS